MSETAGGEDDVIGITHGNGTDGTLHPGLVLEVGVPG